MLLAFTAIFFESAVIVKAKEIPCERFGNHSFYWTSSFHSLEKCFMDKTTTIVEENVKISPRDEFVLGFLLDENKNIFHLPIDVAESFPNLQGFDAYNCSIKEFSKRNFEGLSKLKTLYLGYNQIETIPMDSLIDLIELEFFSLGKIKLNL